MKKNKIIIIFLLIVSLSFITVNVYADDYSDDIYDGDYSIEDMLQNYSVVTFGQKDYDNKVKYLKGKEPNGSLRIFHIVGNFIVKGNLIPTYNSNTNNEYSIAYGKSVCDLGTYNSNYTYNSCMSIVNSMVGKPYYRNDCMSSDSNRYSYFEGVVESPIRITSCIKNTHSELINGSYEIIEDSNKIPYAPTERTYRDSNQSPNTRAGKYMNIERLYSKIVEEQNKIKKGNYINSENGIAHVETGGEYYINDVNAIENLVLDHFEKNKENLTVITITDSGSVTLPKVYDNEIGDNNLIPTNDYSTSIRQNYSYPGNYRLDKYYGNIIWNIPNATYIELPAAPFVGHLIAPNADVEGPELHYAGAFLVNSLSLEGNSEAHFYPLTSTNIPYRSSMDNYKAIPKISNNHGIIKFNNDINNEALEEGIVVSFRVEPQKDYLLSGLEIKDENGNNVEFREIGNGEYEFTMPATNVTITPQFKDNNIINQIITNPKTGSNIMLVLGIIFIGFVFGFRIIKKEKNKIM